jgi:hypothetical protein
MGVSTANAEDSQCYTVESLEGSWALIATYGANVAMAFGERSVGENGNFTVEREWMSTVARLLPRLFRHRFALFSDAGSGLR